MKSDEVRVVYPGEKAFLWVQRNTESRNRTSVGASENAKNVTIRPRVWVGLMWALDVDVLAERAE
jgi:hypothetical protein